MPKTTSCALCGVITSPKNSGKPGWNDDFSDAASNGLFGEPKPIPKRTRAGTNAGVTSKVDSGLVSSPHPPLVVERW